MLIRTKKTNVGQALPLMLVLLFAVSATVFYMFNTGQVVQEKMRLTNTADAVAYSAGVYEARVLNYDAYTNRAIIANEIAIGHALGLASWAKYSATLAENVGEIVQYIPGIGTAIQAALDRYANLAVLELDAFVMTGYLGIADAVNQDLMLSQVRVHEQMATGRMEVMREVARRNDPDVSVELLTDGFDGFTRFNVGNNRERMRQTVERARQQDDFLNSRNWGKKVGTCPPVSFEIKKVGGTGLIGFDGWKSIDTLSLHIDEFDDGSCDDDETPLGYGSSYSADGLSNNYAAYNDSQAANPNATEKALQPDNGGRYGGLAWDDAPESLTGGAIPSHMTLSASALAMPDPRIQTSVRVTKAANDQRFSGGDSVVQPTGRLALYGGRHENAESVSVARAEVYFDRPGGANGGKKEIGSLFNPYWQVRLVPATAADKK